MDKRQIDKASKLLGTALDSAQNMVETDPKLDDFNDRNFVLEILKIAVTAGWLWEEEPLPTHGYN